MSGNNQPVLFENHGIDSRYTGPHAVAPTMSARMEPGVIMFRWWAVPLPFHWIPRNPTV